jgi:hypothetical protein
MQRPNSRSSGKAEPRAFIAPVGDAADQGQRRRADLVDAEQKKLSGFLTPLQRAKPQALREQLNRRVQQMLKETGQRGRRGATP